MRRKSWALGLVAAIALGGWSTAGASVLLETRELTFSPDGTDESAIPHTVSFDWSPANVLSIGGNQAVYNFLTEGPNGDVHFDTYFHSRLTGVNARDLATGDIMPVVVPGLNEEDGFEITFVARLRERVTSANAVGDGGVATFEIVADSASFFEVYYDNYGMGMGGQSSHLTGLGFNDGQLILSGVVDGGFATFFNSGQIDDRFDKAGDVNHYPDLASIIGTGGASFGVTTEMFDEAFFRDVAHPLLLHFGLEFTGLGLGLPFDAVNPSQHFALSAGGVAPVLAGAGLGSESLGSIVGQSLLLPNTQGGADIQFQADASNSFTITLIPEPTTAALGLMSLGVLAAGLRRRR
jgi:hypothetical protein